jgi:hypothetical protein
LVVVGTAFKVEFATEVGANWLGGSLEAEGRGSGGEISGVLTLVTGLLRCNVLFLGDQVVNALFKFHS